MKHIVISSHEMSSLGTISNMTFPFSDDLDIGYEAVPIACLAFHIRILTKDESAEFHMLIKN